jgi:hypothetical protein
LFIFGYLYDMDYRSYFSDLLKESPDYLEHRDRGLDWNVEGISTMLVYFDIVENSLVTISIQYQGNAFKSAWANNANVQAELVAFFKKETENPIWNDVLKRVNLTNRNMTLKGISTQIEYAITKNSYDHTHSNIQKFLFISARIDPDKRNRSDLPVTARLFHSQGDFILSFWQDKDKLKSYRPQIEEYLRWLNLDPKQIDYQSYDMDNREILPYNQFFTVPSNQLSDLEKKEKEIAQQLHVDKAKLDKAILDALFEKPRDINDLYAALEDKLRMPIAKIRHRFQDFPFDKLLKRKVHEYVMEIRKSKKPSV